MSRERSRTLIDRTPQHLPVPLGQLHAAHRHGPLPTRAWSRVPKGFPALLGAAGVLAAACGLALALTAPSSAIGLYPRGVQLDDTILPAVAGGYGGGSLPAVAIEGGQRGAVIAAGNARQNGVLVSGRCTMVRRNLLVTEDCVFRVGARSYLAQDTLDLRRDRVWHRRYADGQSIDIRVPPGAAVTPVPFPTGKL